MSDIPVLGLTMGEGGHKIQVAAAAVCTFGLSMLVRFLLPLPTRLQLACRRSHVSHMCASLSRSVCHALS